MSQGGSLIWIFPDLGLGHYLKSRNALQCTEVFHLINFAALKGASHVEPCIESHVRARVDA